MVVVDRCEEAVQQAAAAAVAVKTAADHKRLVNARRAVKLGEHLDAFDAVFVTLKLVDRPRVA